MVLVLDSELLWNDAAHLRPVFQDIARNIQGLDWIHDRKLSHTDDLALLDCLAPAVEKGDGLCSDQKGLQKYLTQAEGRDFYNSSGWLQECISLGGQVFDFKNITIRWGEPGEKAPCMYEKDRYYWVTSHMWILGLGAGLWNL